MILKNIFFKRILLILVFSVLTLSLLSCSKDCVHCEKSSNSEWYASMLVKANGNNEKFNGYDFNIDLINSYTALKKYFLKHTDILCEDYFCSSLFLFNSIIAVWNIQMNTFEYSFKDVELKGNTLTFDVGVVSPGGCALQPSLYFIVVPKYEIPFGFKSGTGYDVVYV